MKPFYWTVIGAGAAGIAAVGKLLDSQVPAEKILWVDPDFKGGDIGKYWRNVPSNTTVERFLTYFNRYNSFQWSDVSDKLELSKLPPHKTCLLNYTADALQAISEVLQNKVVIKSDWVTAINRKNNVWIVKTNRHNYQSEKIILAQGAEPNQLDLHNSPPMLPFSDAIDFERLKENFNPNFTYGVFGASHSAIIILENLINSGAQKVINFYKHPCKYAVDMGDWILYDDTGLKGNAAAWAKKHIDSGRLPDSLIRVESNHENVMNILSQCDQVTYATGFHRRDNIFIENVNIHQYDSKIGLIDNGLYGYGIAYPEQHTTPIEDIEYRVGLAKFVDYIDNVYPSWEHD